MAAKIFRINYKSDFILTLNSDAGWLTPFCIKFWTGAPNQAYFAGWDGETYTHCAYDPSEPTKLVVQFDDHHLPIGDLKFQIAYHLTVADFPNDTEDEVLNQASVIIEVDDEPAQVMLDLNGETAPEIEFSLPAFANEAQRISNEEQRIAHEAIRIVNEESRIAAEAIRQQNETQRINNEAQRIRNEEARIAEFAQMKANVTEATSAANSAAALANAKAQLAADKAALATDKAALAQSAATLATEKAQLAADKAALAASAAQLADEKAALAQQKATYAEQQGDYAKAQGDYAKAQGDYAKAQAGVIPVDVTRTASDATFVNSNHDSLFYLRQATSSLAGLMTSAEHTKLGALPTAQDLNTRIEGIIYDVSANHPTAGPNNDGKFTLAYILNPNNVNILIPTAVRKGGMSIKFVQTSDNKYVQYLYLSSSTSAAFTNTANWEKTNLYEEIEPMLAHIEYRALAALNSETNKILVTNGNITTSDGHDLKFYNVLVGKSYRINVASNTLNQYSIVFAYHKEGNTTYVPTESVVCPVTNRTIDIIAEHSVLIVSFDHDTSCQVYEKVEVKSIVERVDELEEDTVKSEDIIDNLNSDDSSKPLSAKQGKILNQDILELSQSIEHDTEEGFTDDSIEFQDASGNIVGTIDSEGADFKNLKKNGVEIPLYPATVEETYQKDEEIVFEDSDENPIMKIGETGVKVSSITDMDGNPIVPVYEHPCNITDDIYVAVGRELCLFADCIVKSMDRGLESPINYRVIFNCNIGEVHDRFYRLVPTQAQIGEYAFRVRAFDMNNQVVIDKTSTLKVIPNTGLASQKNIVFIASSDGRGIATSLFSHFQNVAGVQPNFVGTQGNEQTGKYEAYGGWRFYDFAGVGRPAYRCQVVNVDTIIKGAVYEDVQHHQFTVQETNIDADGTGNISLSYISGVTIDNNTTLTKVSGTGDSTVEVTTVTLEGNNPLYNISTQQLDIANYRNTLQLEGKIDIVCISLGANDANYQMSLSGVERDFEKIYNAFIADNPECKVIVTISGTWGNTIGGVRTNGGAAYDTTLPVPYIWSYRNAFFTKYVNNPNFQNLRIACISAQIDRYYGYEIWQYTISKYITEKVTEHSNYWHPNAAGYNQLAEGWLNEILATDLNN